MVLTGAFSFVADVGFVAACDRREGEGVGLGDDEWCGEADGDADGVLAVFVAVGALAT